MRSTILTPYTHPKHPTLTQGWVDMVDSTSFWKRLRYFLINWQMFGLTQNSSNHTLKTPNTHANGVTWLTVKHPRYFVIHWPIVGLTPNSSNHTPTTPNTHTMVIWHGLQYTMLKALILFDSLANFVLTPNSSPHTQFTPHSPLCKTTLKGPGTFWLNCQTFPPLFF